MWKTFLEKALKSELWVTLVAIMASALSAKLGIPESALAELIMSVTGLAAIYVGGRSYAKPKELGALQAELAGKLDKAKSAGL